MASTTTGNTVAPSRNRLTFCNLAIGRQPWPRYCEHMRIKIKRSNGAVEVIDDVDLMLVEDNKGDPVSVACRYGPGDAFLVSCIDDEKRFNIVLRNLGLDRTVVKVNIKNLMKPPEMLPYLIGKPGR